MSAILQITLPVFLVIGAGYFAVWRKFFSDEGVDQLMTFAQTFAVPCLLFSAISTLDLGQDFNVRLLSSFYTGSALCFALGLVGARVVFKRPWEDSVAIAFCAFFANTVLLGLPISERAYGVDSLSPNYAIIAIHAPFCYLLGITTMEIVRASGKGIFATVKSVANAMFHNALMIGIALGFAVNLSGITLPAVAVEAIDLIARAALPAALFGLGGVLYRYKPEGDLREVTFVCVISLLMQPAIVWSMATYVTELPEAQFRAAVLTAAMAPGVNSYIFANIYGVARRVAATSVLVSTALTAITAALWIVILP